MNLESTIKSMVVDVDQSDDFIVGDPISVFPKGYELYDHIYGIYRRGDDKAYTGNFVPIWMYSLIPYSGKTIMYIKPLKKKEEFVNYCGISPEELSRLVIRGEVVPILANHFNEYKEEVFKDFFTSLKNEKFELIRAQLYEDMLITAKKEETQASDNSYLAFEREVNSLEKKYEKTINETSQSVVGNYNREVEKGLAPKLKVLPHFIAERVIWQELCNHPQNVKKIEEGLGDPLKAYFNARFWHYVVVPDIYARYGIAWLADGEDYEIKDRGIQIGLNSSSEIEPIEFTYPKSIKHEDRKRVLGPLWRLIDDYSKEGFEREIQKKGLTNSEKFYKSIPKNYGENVRKLHELSESWNGVTNEYVVRERGSKEIARLHLLHAAFCAPFVNSLKDFLSGEGTISDEVERLYQNIVYLWKLPKRREDRMKHADIFIGKLTAMIKGNEKIRNTPFSVISVSNPQ